MSASVGRGPARPVKWRCGIVVMVNEVRAVIGGFERVCVLRLQERNEFCVCERWWMHEEE
jgi:hypothetical protein